MRNSPRGSKRTFFPCFESRRDSRTKSRSSSRAERKRSESVCGITGRTRKPTTAKRIPKWGKSWREWLRELQRLKGTRLPTRPSTRSPSQWRPKASRAVRGGAGQVRPSNCPAGETQEQARFPMLTKIRERTQDAPLREELFCGEADFRSLAEAVACAIFISREKRLQYVNHAAELITGYALKTLLFFNFWDLVHPDCRELVLKRGGARHGGARRYEVKILTKKVDERWLDISTAMIEFDGMPASLVSAFDLTERKRAEEKVQLLAVTDPLTGLGK